MYLHKTYTNSEAINEDWDNTIVQHITEEVEIHSIHA